MIPRYWHSKNLPCLHLVLRRYIPSPSCCHGLNVEYDTKQGKFDSLNNASLDLSTQPCWSTCALPCLMIESGPHSCGFSLYASSLSFPAPSPKSLTLLRPPRRRSLHVVVTTLGSESTCSTSQHEAELPYWARACVRHSEVGEGGRGANVVNAKLQWNEPISPLLSKSS